MAATSARRRGSIRSGEDKCATLAGDRSTERYDAYGYEPSPERHTGEAARYQVAVFACWRNSPLHSSGDKHLRQPACDDDPVRIANLGIGHGAIDFGAGYGSTKSSVTSRSSPTRRSGAASTAASPPLGQTSPRSSNGTTPIPNRSDGPNPPTTYLLPSSASVDTMPRQSKT